MSKLKYIIAISCVLLYIYTTAPFMLWQDAPQLAGSVASLGISIPAEPVYVLFAHLFTYVPFGSLLFRIHLFNSLLAGITLLLLYELVCTIILPAFQNNNSQSQKNSKFLQQLNISAGIFSMIALAFSYEFWSQAQNVETFILDCLLELIILYLLFNKNIFDNTAKRLLLIFFLCGIATGTDPPVVVSIYPLVLFFAWKWKKELQSKQLISIVFSGLLGVILAWSILALIQLHNPLLDQINGLSLSGIWNIAVGGHQNEYNPTLGIVNGFTWEPSVIGGDALYFIATIWNNFTPFLYLFIIPGCIYLAKKMRRRGIFFALCSIILTNFLFSILYHSGNEENWALQSEVIIAIFAGIGFYWISLVSIRKVSFVSAVYPLVGALLLGLLLVWYWLPILNRNDWNITQDYLNNLYAPLQSPAIMIGSGDTWNSVSDYAYATNFKPGVIPILDNYFYADLWRRKAIQNQTDLQVPSITPLNDQKTYNEFYNDFIAQNISHYRIYITLSALHDVLFQETNLPSFQLDQNKFKLIPSGLVDEIVPKDTQITINENDFNYHFDNNFPNNKPKYFERTSILDMANIADQMALSFDNVATYDIQQGHLQNTENFLLKAYSLSPENTQILDDLGTFYGNQNNYKLALTFFKKANVVDPSDEGTLYEMALANEKLGNITEEKNELETIVNITSPDPNIAPLAAQKLNGLSQQSKVLILPSGWKLFKNQQMNIALGYPPTFTVTQQHAGLLSITNPLLASSDKNDILIYSQSTVNSVLPFIIPSPMDQEQQINLSNMSATMKEYGSGNNKVDVVYFQQKGQSFVVRLPQNQAAIAPNILDQILQSITELH